MKQLNAFILKQNHSFERIVKYRNNILSINFQDSIYWKKGKLERWRVSFCCGACLLYSNMHAYQTFFQAMLRKMLRRHASLQIHFFH